MLKCRLLWCMIKRINSLPGRRLPKMSLIRPHIDLIVNDHI